MTDAEFLDYIQQRYKGPQKPNLERGEYWRLQDIAKKTAVWPFPSSVRIAEAYARGDDLADAVSDLRKQLILCIKKELTR